MRSGFGYPSYQSTFKTWTAVAGGWNANYPLANLGQMVRLQPPARASGGGNRTLTWTLDSMQQVQFFALIGHNLTAGDTYRLRIFSDNNPDPVGNAGSITLDTGVMSIPTAVAGYA